MKHGTLLFLSITLAVPALADAPQRVRHRLRTDGGI